MKPVAYFPIALVLTLSIASCFGPFNPDDPDMGLRSNIDDTLKTTSSMVAWWRCNDSGQTVLKNSAPNDPLNRGFIYYATFDSGVDKSSKSLKFDGAVSHVNINDDSTLDFKTSDFTISLWCKSQIAQSTDTGTLISKGLKGSDSTFSLAISNNRIAMIFGTTIYSPTGDSDSLPAGEWNHIVLKRADHVLSLYVNKNHYSPASSVKNLINNQPLYLGVDGSKHNYFTGNIDEIKIDRKAWSDSDIATEYNNYK